MKILIYSLFLRMQRSGVFLKRNKNCGFYFILNERNDVTQRSVKLVYYKLQLKILTVKFPTNFLFMFFSALYLLEFPFIFVRLYLSKQRVAFISFNQDKSLNERKVNKAPFP